MGLSCQSDATRPAWEPAAAAISLQPLLQQSGDCLGPAVHGRGPRACCAPQLKHPRFRRNLLLVSEMQLLC